MGLPLTFQPGFYQAFSLGGQEMEASEHVPSLYGQGDVSFNIGAYLASREW